MNRTAVRRLIIKILAYSAIKIRANLLLLYSMLKPETSSDSPSERSNGVRLVSASKVINHRAATGNREMRGREFVEVGSEPKLRV